MAITAAAWPISLLGGLAPLTRPKFGSFDPRWQTPASRRRGSNLLCEHTANGRCEWINSDGTNYSDSTIPNCEDLDVLVPQRREQVADAAQAAGVRRRLPGQVHLSDVQVPAQLLALRFGL